MKNLLVVYDDSMTISERIKTILGKKSFGEMILKRQSMFIRTKKLIEENKHISIIKIQNLDDFDPSGLAADTIFMHLLASSAVILEEDFQLLIEKLLYTKDDLVIIGQNTIHGAVLKNRKSYLEFLDEYKKQRKIRPIEGNIIETNVFLDLSNYNHLLLFISGGFDARYFNSLQGDSYTVTKRSSDKKKMKMEYSYYWLLPENMKNWMVMPYNYQEGDGWASYEMERMPMTDIAIRWTHGAVNTEELYKILDKTFYFINHRAQKKITEKEYHELQEKLYIKKLEMRTEKLKKLPEYAKLEQLIKTGTEYKSIDDIVNHYKKIFVRTLNNTKLPSLSVIGHGDLFFANMLYSKELNLLRLIDPKGAIDEKDLWTDPYYDIAKLSHSICGNYDFFNTDSYSITFNKDMLFELNVYTNNSKAKEIFRDFLKKNGYDYKLVRLYEASLFLSMLPLHIDNPKKVFGFILNGIMILKEIEQNV